MRGEKTRIDNFVIRLTTVWPEPLKPLIMISAVVTHLGTDVTLGEVALEQNDLPVIIEAEFVVNHSRITQSDGGFQEHVKYLGVMLNEKGKLFLNQICFTKGERITACHLLLDHPRIGKAKKRTPRTGCWGQTGDAGVCLTRFLQYHESFHDSDLSELLLVSIK